MAAKDPAAKLAEAVAEAQEVLVELRSLVKEAKALRGAITAEEVPSYVLNRLPELISEMRRELETVIYKDTQEIHGVMDRARQTILDRFTRDQDQLRVSYQSVARNAAKNAVEAVGEAIDASITETGILRVRSGNPLVVLLKWVDDTETLDKP